MSKWEQFSALKKDVRIVMELTPELSSSLLINTASLKKMMMLGGFDSLRISSENLAAENGKNLQDSIVRYELSDPSEMPITKLAEWRSVHVIINTYCLNKYVESTAGNVKKIYTDQLDKSLKQALMKAGWENNTHRLHLHEIAIDTLGMSLAAVLAAYLQLNDFDPSLAEYFTSAVSAYILYALTAHGADSYFVSRLKGNDRLKTDLRLSLFRSIHIDRAIVLSLLGKTNTLVAHS